MDATHDSGSKKRASQGPPSSDECGKKIMKEQEKECVEKEQYDYSGFASLPTDVLISILCRSPASDHEALRDTCKSFRTTIDSVAYKGERATSGWAEVSTRLISGVELYDRDYPDGPEDVSLSDVDVGEDATEEERANMLQWKKGEKKDKEMIDYGYSYLGRCDLDYGWYDITHDVKVDGERYGSIGLVLFPRGANHNYPFHEAADAHSSELQEVGWTLCDSVGRLKVRSIKDAELSPGEAGKGGFIHIESVRISEAYRPMDCTNVVSEAVRSALSEPELAGEWSLATAISDYNVYITNEEMKLRRKIRYGGGGETEDKAWVDKRFWECALVDTKTHLRVGLKQIPETVGSQKQTPYWLFALPHFLKDHPMKSFEEVNQTPLIEPPDLPPKPEGIDNEILEAVKKSGNSIRQVLDSVRSARLELEQVEQNPPGDFSELEGKMAEVRSVVEGGKPDHLSGEQWEELVAELERGEEVVRTVRAGIDEVVQGYRDRLKNDTDVAIPRAIEKIKNEINALVEKGGSVRNSYALHCSSRLRLPRYVNFLLDMVPPEERVQAVSGLDDNGLTPLHCVLLGTPEVNDRDEYLDMIERLLGFGADANVKSAQGVTPIGQYRSTISGRFAFTSIFGMRSGDELAKWRPFHRNMKGLLRPSRGETDADVEAKCALLDNDVDPNMNLDDEGDGEDVWMDEEEDEDDDDEDDIDNMERDEENVNDEDEEEE